MKKTEFTKYLKHLDEDELREELLKVYTRFPRVKNYYTIELGTAEDRTKIFDKAKTKIRQIYSKRRARSRISKMNELFKEMTLISIFEHELADLHLYLVERAVECLYLYGYYKQADLNSIKKHYNTALEKAKADQSEEQLQKRARNVLSETGFDYFFEKDMHDIYRTHFD